MARPYRLPVRHMSQLRMPWAAIGRMMLLGCAVRVLGCLLARRYRLPVRHVSLGLHVRGRHLLVHPRLLACSLELASTPWTWYGHVPYDDNDKIEADKCYLCHASFRAELIVTSLQWQCRFVFVFFVPGKQASNWLPALKIGLNTSRS